MVAFPRDFSGQFLIGHADQMPAVERGEARRLNRLAIATIGQLPLTPVHDRAGRLVGAFLGYPIDYRREQIIKGNLELEFDWPSLDGIDAAIENAVYGFGGKFVFVLDDDQLTRVYLDAGGSLSAVFDPKSRRCAATTGLLLNPSEYQERFNRSLYNYLGVIDEGWFPAGLTAHRGIGRILGNHYLDLADGVQRRHWPREPLALAADPDEACAVINSVVSRTIKTLLAAGTVATTLTAGSETRLVLGACKAFKDSLRLFTLAGVNETELDALRAQQLASAFELNHSILPIQFADDDGVEQWCARSSHCIGGPNSRSYPSIEPISEYTFFTGGVGGETGRGFFWRTTDTPDLMLDAHGLTARMGMPVHEEVVAAVDLWLQALPKLDVHHKLDLAFVELRLGCWGFSQAYASPEICEIQPLVSRETFVAMLSLPTEWRRSNRMITRCIELSWPELLGMPINAYGDLRDFGRPFIRALRNPKLILKKLRKKFG